jgi:hypothetical protein
MLELAARGLERAWGEAVFLRNPVLLKEGDRAAVVRCEVDGPREVASVILKQGKVTATERLVFADWACLAFLSGTTGPDHVAPRFLGGDVDAALVVMEDLGEGRTLAECLEEDDGDVVRDLFLSWATRTARMQADTLGQEDAFLSQSRGLPASAVHDRRQEAERWLRGRERLDAWLIATGLPTPTGFEACMGRIAGTFSDPGPWLAFTHGDPAPTNNHVAGDRIHLLDFEYGGYRHALYDITGWYALCPLPLSLVQEMSSRYRQMLAHSCPVAQDEALYREAWASLCSYRALALLSWISPDVLTEDAPWVGEWTRRAAAHCAASRLHAVAAGDRRLAAAAEFGHRLEEHLLERWPELAGRQPDWPALRAPASE